MLLERGTYETSTSGHLLTFSSYGIAGLVMGVRLSGRFLKPLD